MGRLIAALSAVVLGVLGTTGTAQAADEPWLASGLWGSSAGEVRIQFARTDKCLDAALEEIDNNGGKVQMWTCGLGGDEQYWYAEYHEEWGASLVRNKANGKCLDVALEEIDLDGGKLQMWDCTGNIEQRWTFQSHQGDLFMESMAVRGAFGAPSLTDGAPIGLYNKI
ncbi:RICIN domain-containing protein [Lentzea sp. NPDC005914]|uniref:RICIN domain-containing protein n=1 Tax=Lentzea sp. NPDC005914 TaxID=3154572 RepID=UPI0033CD2A5C